MSNLTQQAMNAYYQRDTEALQRLTDGAAIREQSTARRINSLAEALAPHIMLPARWLREAVAAHFSGKPIPPLE